MNKKLFLILPFLFSAAYATNDGVFDKKFKQIVSIYLNVEGDANTDGFYAGFTSSDPFDTSLRHTTTTVKNGTAMQQHVYSYGPKRIRVFVHGSYPYLNTYVKVKADNSCKFMVQSEDNKFDSDYIDTSKPNVTWTFNLKQAAPENGYRYVYSMNCVSKEY